MCAVCWRRAGTWESCKARWCCQGNTGAGSRTCSIRNLTVEHSMRSAPCTCLSYHNACSRLDVTCKVRLLLSVSTISPGATLAALAPAALTTSITKAIKYALRLILALVRVCKSDAWWQLAHRGQHSCELRASWSTTTRTAVIRPKERSKNTMRMCSWSPCFPNEIRQNMQVSSQVPKVQRQPQAQHCSMAARSSSGSTAAAVLLAAFVFMVLCGALPKRMSAPACMIHP